VNERLRQFEKESKLEIFGLGAKRVPWEAALEKYAELIVRECIDTVLDSSVEYCTRPQIAKELKEHFGVEE
jgi:hypothetical protein